MIRGYKKLLERVEQFTSDAAGDEIVAAEMLQAELPSLKIRTKDTAHASRRTS